MGQKLAFLQMQAKLGRTFCEWYSLKVAEHSFQVPLPNSPLLSTYLYSGIRFCESLRLTIEKFILAFCSRYVLLPWQRGWLKTRLKK